MKQKLRELFADVYYALKDLMYSNMIDTETFIKLDKLVKTPLFNIFQELYENKKNQNSRKYHK